MSCSICTTVTDCWGAAVSGATVTVSLGGTTIGTCTTNGSGYCCVSVTSAGTYNVAAALTGYTGSNSNVTVTGSCSGGGCTTAVIQSPGNCDCSGGGTFNVTLILTTSAPQICSFLISGCNAGSQLALQGATCTVTGSGSGGGTTTTDATGAAAVAIGNGSWSWSVSAPRMVTQTGSFTESGCLYGQTVTIDLVAATGYQCCGGSSDNCSYPIATTLHFTGPPGSVTLTSSGSCTWSGCATISSGVACTASCTPTSGSIVYSVSYFPGQFLQYGLKGNIAGTCIASNSCAGGFLLATLCTSTLGIPATQTPTPGPTCPVLGTFSESGSLSGYTGFAAMFNGAWTVTE